MLLGEKAGTALGEKLVITGGTGSLGQVLVRKLFDKFRRVFIYSRDEYKQSVMERELSYDNLRFFLGDVRDRSRLTRVLSGAECCIHTAALKQVPKLEYNPTEAVLTNVIGTMNVVEACIDNKVSTAVLISTDKAVNPVNLYGATKLTAEKVFLAANCFNETKFTVVRYGNVLSSRGSVIELFNKLKAAGIKEFPITSLDMTRFWISLDEAAELVCYSIKNIEKVVDKIIVPHIPSMKISALAEAILPDCVFKHIGIRAGEKLHETLISRDEKNAFMLIGDELVNKTDYRSDNNNLWMTKEQLRAKL